jgi:pyrimidine deaminase RibD-like protein
MSNNRFSLHTISRARLAFPKANVGAVLVGDDDVVISESCSDYYQTFAVRPLLENIGIQILPGAAWTVSWPSSPELRHRLASATLFLTLEPSSAQTMSLIAQAGITRVVIGALHPIPEMRGKGVAALQAAGIQVGLVPDLEEECQLVIQDYAEIANSKFQRMARKHFELFGRPLGFLHCSVIDSEIVKAFIEQSLGSAKQPKDDATPNRSQGPYELAPPPDMIWTSKSSAEELAEGEGMAMPWYEQADAVVATFPRPGNGPPDDDSVAGRLFGVRWLATHGSKLPAAVERILVLDATDLKDLPLVNGDPNLPPSIDIEAFWAAQNRKPTRIILRRGDDRVAQDLAKAAAAAAEKAAEAALLAAAAIRPGDAARAAEIALECQKSAQASADFVMKELHASTEMRRKLEALGVIVESIEGGDPIDVVNYLGEQYGMHSVVWRAGCWGERGVRIVMSGAFQWVSAHLTVQSEGSKFWQLMKAENAVQGTKRICMCIHPLASSVSSLTFVDSSCLRTAQQSANFLRH